jgi:acyl-CoA hydrolase
MFVTLLMKFKSERKFMEPKRVADSLTEQVQILMPSHINGQDRLFGGQLVEWIDVVAAVVARRHSGCNVTTAAIDNLQFKAGAYINNTLVLIGHMTYVGKTSMEVRVDTYAEDLNGIRKVVNRAYLVLVALDEEGKPTEVPKLILETEAEKAEWEAGKKRHALRSKRRKEGY